MKAIFTSSDLSNEAQQLTNRQIHLRKQNEIGKIKSPLYEVYNHKPNSVNMNQDIQGCHPFSVLDQKTQHYENNRYQKGSQSRYQTNYVKPSLEDDKPNIVKFKTSRFDTNPLTPVYQLPSYEQSCNVQNNKFLRNTLDISDIAGQKVERKKLNIVSETNRIHIDQKRDRRVIRDHNSLSVKDINQDRIYNFRTKRQYDPLNPDYKIFDSDLVKIDHEYSLRKFKPELKREYNNANVDDIVGQNILQRVNGKVTKDGLTNADIVGTQASTKPIKISTHRQTNPLNPTYKYLDGTKNDI